jgi:hypothetical protein
MGAHIHKAWLKPLMHADHPFLCGEFQVLD